jgi:hypothetical protein
MSYRQRDQLIISQGETPIQLHAEGVGIVQLNGRGVRRQSPIGVTSSGLHPASYPTGAGSSVPEG